MISCLLDGFSSEMEKISFKNPITTGMDKSLHKYFNRKNLLLGGLLFGAGAGTGTYISNKFFNKMLEKRVSNESY